MSHEEQLRELVDRAHSSIDKEICSDIRALYKHYGILSDGSISRSEIIKFLQRRIFEKLLTTEKNLRSIDFFKLFSQLIRRHIVDGTELLPYLTIVDVVQEEAKKLQPNQYFLSFNYTAEWQNALLDVNDLILIQPPFADLYTTAGLERFRPRLVKPAQKVAWLKNNGYSNIPVVNGKFDISTEDLMSLVDSIEQDILKYGGLNLSRQIFSGFSRIYDQRQDRYHLGRRCNTTGKGIEPRIPMGYILNLCIKPNNFIEGGNNQRDLDKITEKTIALACLYDVQPYSTFELEFKIHDNLIEFLTEISIFDSLFTFKQLRPTDVCKMIRGIFDWVDETRMRDNLGWTLDQGIKVIEVILQLVVPPDRAVSFTEASLFAEIPEIPGATVKLILDALTHLSPKPNNDFIIPHDIKKADAQFKPLVRSGETYFLIDTSWSGIGFYEAIAMALRSFMEKEVQENIGPAAESFLKSELTRKGVTYKSGEYSNKKGECDIVIETTETIIFIEVKNKPLTRKAQGGSDVDILVDVSCSLIDSQIQLGNHEILIRKNGFLELKDSGGNNHRIELKGRAIERISLTVLDYGGLNDRRVLSQVLALALSAQFNATGVHNEKLDELNEKCSQLQSQAIELNEMGAWHKIPYFNCWFLSIPQFLILLDYVKSNEDFKRELFSTKFVTFGSLDFYHDFAAMKGFQRGDG